MADLLTPEEVRALLSSLSAEKEAGEGESRGGGGERPPQARDFRAFRKGGERLRALRDLKEPLERKVAASFSGYLGAFVKARVTSIDTLRYGEFARSAASTAVAGVFALPPFREGLVVGLTPGVALAMIDRLLGGPGTSAFEARGLTALERPLARRLLEKLADSLHSAWPPLAGARPEFLRLEPDVSSARVLPPWEAVAAIRLELGLNEVEGGAALFLAYSVIEEAVPEPAARGLSPGGTGAPAPGRRERLEAAAIEARAPARVVVGEAWITLRELLDLRPGDCLVLETPKEGLLPLFTGEDAKFYVRPGRSGDRLAVELVRRAGEEREE